MVRGVPMNASPEKPPSRCASWPAVEVHEAIELRAFLARFVDSFTDDYERTRQDLEVIAVATELVHAAFDVRIEVFAIR